MSITDLVYALHVISYAAFGISLVATPFLFYNWIQYTAAKRTEKDSGGIFVATFPRKSVGFFVGGVITGIISVSVITYFASNETADFLNSLSEHYSVKINDDLAENPRQIVAELKKVGYVMAHHSHPTKTIQVEIEDSGKRLVLDLRRDSDVPTEYWVFNPAFDEMNEIGRITTPIFDQY